VGDVATRDKSMVDERANPATLNRNSAMQRICHMPERISRKLKTEEQLIVKLTGLDQPGKSLRTWRKIKELQHDHTFSLTLSR